MSLLSLATFFSLSLASGFTSILRPPSSRPLLTGVISRYSKHPTGIGSVPFRQGSHHKVVEQFGSFSNYCWGFVSHKPIMNGFRYPRQVPVRTPKAEAISRDLIKRGLHCMVPTVVYSFMQAAGIVNDHLSSCFRYKECNLLNETTNAGETATLAKELDSGCSLEL